MYCAYLCITNYVKWLNIFFFDSFSPSNAIRKFCANVNRVLYCICSGERIVFFFLSNDIHQWLTDKHVLTGLAHRSRLVSEGLYTIIIRLRNTTSSSVTIEEENLWILYSTNHEILGRFGMFVHFVDSRCSVIRFCRQQWILIIYWVRFWLRSHTWFSSYYSRTLYLWEWDQHQPGKKSIR